MSSQGEIRGILRGKLKCVFHVLHEDARSNNMLFKYASSCPFPCSILRSCLLHHIFCFCTCGHQSLQVLVRQESTLTKFNYTNPMPSVRYISQHAKMILPRTCLLVNLTSVEGNPESPLFEGGCQSIIKYIINKYLYGSWYIASHSNHILLVCHVTNFLGSKFGEDIISRPHIA
jgi:hypothetical protein